MWSCIEHRQESQSGRVSRVIRKVNICFFILRPIFFRRNKSCWIRVLWAKFKENHTGFIRQFDIQILIKILKNKCLLGKNFLSVNRKSLTIMTSRPHFVTYKYLLRSYFEKKIFFNFTWIFFLTDLETSYKKFWNFCKTWSKSFFQNVLQFNFSQKLVAKNRLLIWLENSCISKSLDHELINIIYH